MYILFCGFQYTHPYLSFRRPSSREQRHHHGERSKGKKELRVDVSSLGHVLKVR